MSNDEKPGRTVAHPGADEKLGDRKNADEAIDVDRLRKKLRNRLKQNTPILQNARKKEDG